MPLLPETQRGLVDLSREARGWINGGKTVYWSIVGVLVVLWLLGFIGNYGGPLIHLLLAAAAIMFVVNLLSNRRTI